MSDKEKDFNVVFPHEPISITRHDTDEISPLTSEFGAFSAQLSGFHHKYHIAYALTIKYMFDKGLFSYYEHFILWFTEFSKSEPDFTTKDSPKILIKEKDVFVDGMPVEKYLNKIKRGKKS